EIGDSEDDGDVRDHEQMLLLLIIILFVCKPWRFLPRSRSSPFSTFKVGDLQRPLACCVLLSLRDDGFTNQGFLLLLLLPISPKVKSFSIPLPYPVGILELIHRVLKIYESESFDLQIISEPSDNALVGETLKHPADKVSSQEVQTYGSQQPDLEKDILSELSPRVVVKDQRSWLSLEVIAGPSVGLQYAVNSTSTSKLPVKLGRVSSDMILKDSEVSGKHAQITWNSTKLKWELVDMGSLNGTLLNSRSVSHPDLGSRKWGHPVELASDDIITLGTTSMVSVSFI
ncbi:unnamed protein product, partial [Brassica rapa subsp. narinosa]